MNLFKLIKDHIIKSLLHLKIWRMRKAAIRWEKDNWQHMPLEELTSMEKSEIKNIWSPLKLKINYTYYRLFKTLKVYQANFISDDLFYPYILRSLNPDNRYIPYADKSNYDIIYKGIKQPRIYIKQIKGILYNGNNEVISAETANKILKNNSVFILKESSASSGGRGVKKFKTEDVSIFNLLENFKNDFVIQEVIKQSPKTAILNPTSLNCFRISTLFINGIVTNCHASLKFGNEGSIVDNVAGGGFMVGVHDNGQLDEYAYTKKFKKTNKTSQGIELKSICIPEIKKVIDFAKENHMKFLQQLGYVGWDIALDENNEPTLIEVNLSYPGVLFEQICLSKPAFADRTEEVIEFVKNNPPKIHLF